MASSSLDEIGQTFLRDFDAATGPLQKRERVRRLRRILRIAEGLPRTRFLRILRSVAIKMLAAEGETP